MIIRSRNLLLLMTLMIFGMSGCGPQQKLKVEFLEKESTQHIRVMSFNVGWDSIFPDNDLQNNEWRRDNTEAKFIRILKAIKPDIVCLQEINPVRDPQQVSTILDNALPLAEGRAWQAHKGQDNVILTRFDITMQEDELGYVGGTISLGHAIALVDLPDAEYDIDIYLICAHFQAGGGQENIRARQEHADVIVEWVGDAKTEGGDIDLPYGTPIIVLGDFNIYDTDPAHHLVTLLTGDIENEDMYGQDISPDWDNSDLADAMPRHNAVVDEIYTWRDDTQEFNPGALDRILYTDSVVMVKNSFVMNTTILTEDELETAGLQVGDVALDFGSGRYDHLPLVVDITFQGIQSEQ